MEIQINKKVGIFIPTLNAEGSIDEIISAINSSVIPVENVLVIDSESTDSTARKLKKYNVLTRTIARSSFSHGKVRRMAVELMKSRVDFLVVMTQDVKLTSASINKLIEGIQNNPRVGVSYGCQRSTHIDTVEYLDKKFNYPEKSQLKSKDLISQLGASTYFSSDAFAVYRIEAVLQVGNFPEDVKFAEDAYLAGKLILSEWQVFYNAEAIVYHDNLSNHLDLYKRYRNIAKFYQNERWLSDVFGGNMGKGRKLVLFELKQALVVKSPGLFLDVLVSSSLKLLAYKLPARSV